MSSTRGIPSVGSCDSGWVPAIPIYLESGAKRVFAAAVDWPGWARTGKTEVDAIAALAAYAPRFARVVRGVVPQFAQPTGAADLKVVRRLKGGSGTDFGVPSNELPSDKERVDETELTRLTQILEACWAAFDRAAESATGHELRKGPRGGGRDLDKIVAHVNEADAAYIAQLGSRAPKNAGARVLRAAMLGALRARVRGEEIADPTRVKKKWAPRYFARRVAWHVLDHAWEIEDRAIFD